MLLQGAGGLLEGARGGGFEGKVAPAPPLQPRSAPVGWDNLPLVDGCHPALGAGHQLHSPAASVHPIPSRG